MLCYAMLCATLCYVLEHTHARTHAHTHTRTHSDDVMKIIMTMTMTVTTLTITTTIVMITTMAMAMPLFFLSELRSELPKQPRALRSCFALAGIPRLRFDCSSCLRRCGLWACGRLRARDPRAGTLRACGASLPECAGVVPVVLLRDVPRAALAIF